MSAGSALNLSGLHHNLKQTLEENTRLRNDLTVLQYRFQQLEIQTKIDHSQLLVHDIALEQQEIKLRAELNEEHQRTIDLIQQDVAKVECHNAQLVAQVASIQDQLVQKDHELHLTHSHYLMQLESLYKQLQMYQTKETIYLAKAQLEEKSRATLVVDKINSPNHVERVTTGRDSTKDAPSTDGEPVLCTRDQIRLTISGTLHELQSLGDVRWYRSRNGTEFVQIPNAGGRSQTNANIHDSYGLSMLYIPTVDDLYCTIRCQFVEPMTGATLYAEIGPVVPDKELLESTVDGYKRNEVELTVLISDNDIDALLEKEKEFEKGTGPDRRGSVTNNMPAGAVASAHQDFGMGGSGGVMMEYKLTLSTKKIIITGRRGTKKVSFKHTIDAASASSLLASAHNDSSTGFSIYLMSMWVNCAAPNRHTRDVLLALTRLFTQQTRINDVSTESEKYREKQYSSSWMLSLINLEHDMTTSMPKSKRMSSDQISANADLTNVGEMMLAQRLSLCTFQKDASILNTLGHPFDHYSQFVVSTAPNHQPVVTEVSNADVAQLWTTRSEFEKSALSHTQLATIDEQFSKPKSPTNPQVAELVLTHQLSSASTSSFLSQQPPLQEHPTPHPEQPVSAAKKYTSADEEYVPYDIDDVTPQLGQGKQRGFDDLIVDDSSDEDGDAGGKPPRNTNGRPNTSRAGIDDEGESGSHFAGQPVIQVNIKKAEDVVVDQDANKAKIQQIFTQPGGGGANTTTGRRRVQQQPQLKQQQQQQEEQQQ